MEGFGIRQFWFELFEPALPRTECPRCRGTGTPERTQAERRYFEEHCLSLACERCSGSGQVGRHLVEPDGPWFKSLGEVAGFLRRLQLLFVLLLPFLFFGGIKLLIALMDIFTSRQ